MHRITRRLAVFAVLVGLLAMHGVRGEHSAMGGPAMGPKAMTASVVEPAVTGLDRPSQPAMTSMATLCLAIRHSDRTPGLRAGATPVARRMTHRSGPDPRPARVGAEPRPPDLVAGLCVSRT